MTNVAPRKTLAIVEHQPQPVGPFTLTGTLISTNKAISLGVTGSPGAVYVFEVSTNLMNWSKIAVRSNATGTVTFTDLAAARFSRRFYRVSAP